jgi:predicted TIM-barrel fold metal-dependent hydrolase
MSDRKVRAIDPWVNIDMLGGQPPPKYLQRVKEDYFKGDDSFFEKLSIEALLAQMDEAGVEKAVLSTDVFRVSDEVLAFCDQQPERFALAANCDPTKHMKTAWALEELVARAPVVMARVVPFMHDLPPNHRSYYPLYAKCCDLDLPISINTGIPGPPMPGECQHPMHLDRVCLDFPKLKVCMAHGADPWWGEATRLMIKYEHLYMMTSAYLPKYFPDDFVHFMNTRGRHKVLYASDHPVLDMRRVIDEALKLDLREGVLERYLYENAHGLFFGPRSPRSGRHGD